MKLKLLKIITPSGVPGPSGPGAKDNLNNKKLINQMEKVIINEGRKV